MEWLIAVTGLPFDILILVLLAVAGAFAGFVDSIVGGGGLILWCWQCIDYIFEKSHG